MDAAGDQAALRPNVDIVLVGDWEALPRHDHVSASGNARFYRCDLGLPFLPRILEIQPSWLLLGTGIEEDQASDLASSAVASLRSLFLGVIGPSEDLELADRWAYRGARLYLDTSTNPSRLLEAMRTSISLDLLLFDARLQLAICARQAEVPGFREGRLRLGDTELAILRGLEHGLQNQEIAKDLHLSRRTIESHLTALYQKLNARGRLNLAKRVRELAI